MARELDDEVGTSEGAEGLKQTPEQEHALGSTPEAGRPEPKSRQDWAERGGNPDGKDPPSRGGSSQGHSDGEPA